MVVNNGSKESFCFHTTLAYCLSEKDRRCVDKHFLETILGFIVLVD